MRNDLLKQAKHYHSLGLNIICIGDRQNIFNYSDNNILKAPNHEWKLYKEKEQSSEYVELLDWENAVGVGIILGYKNICAIDIDGCADFSLITNICKILDLSDDYEWIFKTGSKAGYHIVFQCNDIVQLKEIKSKNVKMAQASKDTIPFANGDTNAYYPYFHRRNFQKIEFKWSGNLVLPESLHITGNYYEFCTKMPTAFPSSVKFCKLLSVKNIYGSLQTQSSEIYGSYFITQFVADKDEEQFEYTHRRREPYILFDIRRYKIHYDNSDFSSNNLYIIQISWFVVDNNLNVLKRKIFNYFKEEKINCDKFDGVINFSRAESIATNRRNVFFEFLFDLDHVEKIITLDNTSVDFIKNEIAITGLYIDNFQKKEEYLEKEIIFVCENNSDIILSINELYHFFLQKNGINCKIENLSDHAILSAIYVANNLIAKNKEIIEDIYEDEKDCYDDDDEDDDYDEDDYNEDRGSDDEEYYALWGQKRGLCDIADNCYGCPYADKCF
jgi:hypothetical protein